ncbi:MAG: hypothetical protein A2X84_05835 [Desulfuromonadaceae bacterium GWC2_58_13]|nr:MAG: hypothetical protein A2X84_05835 [Desulfuromonadaceae bacterium GWC2_58_13]
MNDRVPRHSKRFVMQLPAFVKPCAGVDGGDPHLLLTRDISDRGAYFSSMEPMVYAGQVQVEVLLRVPGCDDQDIYLCMTTRGVVVRCEVDGLAVRFIGESRLSLMTKTN